VQDYVIKLVEVLRQVGGFLRVFRFPSLIVCFLDIGRIVDHHRLDVIVRFVDLGKIVDHHCLEGVVCLIDIGL
jgi:hypothetical protein